MEIHSSFLPADSFSPDEQQLLPERLWKLLSTQANRYLGCDSTSLTVERTECLLESMLYTLSLVLPQDCAKSDWLTEDLAEKLSEGQKLLQQKKRICMALWQQLCTHLPSCRTVYLDDTLKSIGQGFRQYDLYYEAHLFPASIDYWLLSPVSEKKKGLSFLEDYLQRLLTEIRFLSLWDENRVHLLYQSFQPDYSEGFFNLCEPILLNAIGLSLLGQDVRPLSVSFEQRYQLLCLLQPLPTEELSDTVAKAVSRLFSSSPKEALYFRKAARELSVPLWQALSNGNLSRFFLTF